MTDSREVQQQARVLRTHLQQLVQDSLTQYAHQLTLVIQNNPHSDLHSLLTRPDISRALASSLDSAKAAAVAAVSRAAGLGGDQSSTYQRSIAQDVEDAYSRAAAQVRSAVATAFNSVQPHAFQPGTDAPGTNPVFAAAQARSQAVHAAITHEAAALALRNGLSVNVAGARGYTESVIEDALARYQAGEDLWIEWHSRLTTQTCAWCRALHGHRVRPGEEFPHPEAIGHRHPPRLYQGVLHGPPLHPNCQCWPVIVVSGQPPVALPAELALPPAFIDSQQIREMPEEKYNHLLAFLSAALHELGQVLSRVSEAAAVSAVAGAVIAAGQGKQEQAASRQRSQQTYTVQPGDSLSSIADRLGTTWQVLYAQNRDAVGPDPSLIHAGLRLTLTSTTARYRALYRYIYSKAIVDLVEYARENPEHPFSFGPLDLKAVEQSGLIVTGTDLSGVSDVLSRVHGLAEVPA